MRLLHGIASITLLVACGTDSTDTGPDAQPTPKTTWYQDVAPIVSKHCMSCHQDGGIAPFSLTAYADAQANSMRMVTQVDSGTMPPFDAREEVDCTPRFGWQDDPRLSDAEKTTIHQWITDGTPEGTVADIPKPPSTDLAGVTMSLKPAVPFSAGGTRDQFTCFILDPNIPASQGIAWMTGMQVRPDNASVVHHVVLSELAPGTDQTNLVNAHGIGQPFDCEAGTPANFTMAIWTPGNQPMQTPADLAVPIQAGAKIVMQIHYHPAGVTAQPDATSVDLRLSTQWPTKMYFVAAFGNAFQAPQLLPDPDDTTTAPEFTIPKNKPDHVENMRFQLPDLSSLGPDVRVYSVNPHMHLTGTHVNGKLTRANAGTEPQQECLANGGWNFDWQRTYTYATPLDQLPSLHTGDTIEVGCHWNNTIENPFVQRMLHDAGLVAPIDIHLGEMKTNEMCLEIFGITVNAPAQPTGRTIPTITIPNLGLNMAALAKQ